MTAGRAEIRSHKDLEVWQKAVEVAVLSYRLTAGFPRDELYGMTAQIRRSSTSIAANIAEGFGRDQTGGFIQFLRIALGSTRELDTHITISVKVGLLPAEAVRPIEKECDDISRMLRSLIRKLEVKKTDD